MSKIDFGHQLIESIFVRLKTFRIMPVILFTVLSSVAYGQHAGDLKIDPLFQSTINNIPFIRPVGDIEGMAEHFETLDKEGTLRWNSQTAKWERQNPLAYPLFNGDYMRRGPYGIRTVEAIVQLLEDQALSPGSPEIFANIGNHDGNILSWQVYKTKILAGLVPDYYLWLEKNGRTDTLASKIFYWAHSLGISEKVENFWLEMVLIEKFNAQPNDFHSPHEAQFYTHVNGRKAIDLQNLNRYIPESRMAEAFDKFVSPGGRAWRLLELASIRGGHHFTGFDTIIDFSHSGISSLDNFGVTPTQSRRRLNQSDELNPSSYYEWLSELDSSFKDEGLKSIRALNKEIESVLSHYPPEHPERVRLLTYYSDMLSKIELISNVDSLWSQLFGGFFRTDSQIYPDPRTMKETSLPTADHPEIVNRKAKIGIKISIGGHKPVGHLGTLMVAFDVETEKFVLSLFHDTSYSPVEGKNEISVYANGAVRVVGTLPDGKIIVLERPSDKDLNKWKNEIRPYIEELRKAQQEYRSANVPEGIEEKFYRLDRYSRLGKVVGGRLILGFTTKKNSNGELVADYDNYMTVQQVGRSYNYLPIEIWGMFEYEKNVGPLQYPQQDLKDMLAKTEAEKKQKLKDSKRAVLSPAQFKNALKGKHVVDLAGYSANISQVQRDSEGNQNIEESKIAFRQMLNGIPLDKDVVFLTGGTVGWESILTEIIAEVNKVRKAQKGKPFDVIGCAALVFGLGEVDPNIKKMFLVPNTFYWHDFKPNLMNGHVLQSGAATIDMRIAGGGPIIADQIRQSLGYAQKDRRVSVTLEVGITPDPKNKEFKKRAAADKFYDSLEFGSEQSRLVSVVRANSGRFETIGGTQNPRSFLLSIENLAHGQVKAMCEAAISSGEIK